MDYNYHAHTFRCGHATGTPEEYVLWAIEHGVRYMGFSEHAPFRFPNGFESDYRLPMNEIADYIANDITSTPSTAISLTNLPATKNINNGITISLKNEMIYTFFFDTRSV